ncbi:uncharacterized protein I206_105638 [Kwoniella pini CBS 10737]|uniref:Uncharacterized protein n=1 Tax=Kwoniella pini CBS 10737 TaxID=1296096 RepID=A0A1B9I3P1_9TREE|nr:uncharacterized protein I206_03462 [Kwoniella pini CBS 10737]OCF50143.1 hypothetical protein I206_03462 [Kwoniella pini CBS 10737]
MDRSNSTAGSSNLDLSSLEKLALSSPKTPSTIASPWSVVKQPFSSINTDDDISLIASNINESDDELQEREEDGTRTPTLANNLIMRQGKIADLEKVIDGLKAQIEEYEFTIRYQSLEIKLLRETLDSSGQSILLATPNRDSSERSQMPGRDGNPPKSKDNTDSTAITSLHNQIKEFTDPSEKILQYLNYKAQTLHTQSQDHPTLQEDIDKGIVFGFPDDDVGGYRSQLIEEQQSHIETINCFLSTVNKHKERIQEFENRIQQSDTRLSEQLSFNSQLIDVTEDLNNKIMELKQNVIDVNNENEVLRTIRSTIGEQANEISELHELLEDCKIEYRRLLRKYTKIQKKYDEISNVSMNET